MDRKATIGLLVIMVLCITFMIIDTNGETYNIDNIELQQLSDEMITTIVLSENGKPIETNYTTELMIEDETDAIVLNKQWIEAHQSNASNIILSNMILDGTAIITKTNDTSIFTKTDPMIPTSFDNTSDIHAIYHDSNSKTTYCYIGDCLESAYNWLYNVKSTTNGTSYTIEMTP